MVLDTEPAPAQPGTQAKLAGWGERLHWPGLGWAQTLWTLTLLPGLIKARLGFVHGGTDGDEMLGTRGRTPLILHLMSQINLPMPCPPGMGPGMPSFDMNPLPPATT